MITPELVEKCVLSARYWEETWGSLDEHGIPISRCSDTTFEADPHAVSMQEALSYYAGLPSEPILIYRTGKPWYPPEGPEAYRRTKELRPVFNHPIVDLWSNGLSDEVIKVLDTHAVSYCHFAVLV